MRRFLLILLASLLAAPALAGDKETINHRKNVIGAAGRAAVALADIAKGELSQSDQFADIARLFAEAAALSPAAFAADTRGSAVDSDSKDAVWEDWDDFSRRMDAYAKDAATVAALAEEGDIDGAKQALFPMFKTHCKGCHDKYRE